jgi:hypothetical protein
MGTCLIIGGIVVVIFIGIIPMYKNITSMNWPTITASIASSTVEKIDTHQKVRFAYKPLIIYTYTINDKSYSGNTRTFGEAALGNPSLAQLVVSEYPLGESIKIHYNPTNPEESVIEAGFSYYNLGAIFIGLLLTLGGLITMKYKTYPSKQ